MTTRSGLRKSATAVPSRRNSGLDTTATSGRWSTSSTARVEPTGTVDLLTTRAPGRSTDGDLGGGGLDVAQVGAAVGALWRRARRGTRRRRRSAAAAAPTSNVRRPVGERRRDDLGEALLDDRDLATAQPGDAVLVEVGAHHPMAEVGKAGGGREADVAGADDADPATAARSGRIVAAHERREGTSASVRCGRVTMTSVPRYGPCQDGVRAPRPHAPRIPHRTGARPARRWRRAATVAAAVYLLVAGRLLRPPRVVASEETSEIGPETPAVASLLTNGFVVTPNAAVATLFDLAARGWLRIVAVDDEVIVLTDGHGAQGDVLTALRAAGPQPPAPSDRRNGQRGHRRRHRGRRAAPAAPLVASLQRRRRRRRPAPGPVPAALEPACCSSFRRSLVGIAALAALAIGARRRRDRSRRVAAPAGRGGDRRVAHRRRRLADRQTGACRRPSDRPPTGLQRASVLDVAARPGWSRAASKGHRASSPTTPAGRSATPPPSGSPSGPPPSCRWCPRTTARRGATPPARGTSSRCATRSARASVAIRLLVLIVGLVARRRHHAAAAPPPRHRQRLHARRVHRRQLRRPGRASSTTSPSDSPPCCCCRCCGCCGSSSPGRSTCSPPIERRGLVVRARRPQRVCRTHGCSARSPGATATRCSSPSTTAAPTGCRRGWPTSALPSPRARGPECGRLRCSGTSAPPSRSGRDTAHDDDGSWSPTTTASPRPACTSSPARCAATARSSSSLRRSSTPVPGPGSAPCTSSSPRRG